MSLELARKVLTAEAEAILEVREKLDGEFLEAVEILHRCRGRIVTTGMGKSGIIARKIAATLASTGSPALFMHPAEAIHGDLGILVPGDVILALSNSGETAEIIRLLEHITRLSIPLIALTGQPGSTIARHADVHLDAGISAEACHLGIAPTASTTASLALGDALAVALSARKGFSLENFAALHPGGKIGKKLRQVADLMRTGSQVPQARPDSLMSDVIVGMSEGRMGIIAITDAGGMLQGVISDGDLRRLLQKRGDILKLTAGECMTGSPKTVPGRELASRALALMEQNQITSLFIVDESGRLEGAIHLHDLWQTDLF